MRKRGKERLRDNDFHYGLYGRLPFPKMVAPTPYILFQGKMGSVFPPPPI